MTPEHKSALVVGAIGYGTVLAILAMIIGLIIVGDRML